MTMDSSDGIRSVVLRRSSDAGLGFSIMGGAGYEFPPVIYGIEKDSPAARSGLLEAGDIILAINEREVVRLSTKEVLKCLRLSGDIVNIKYKRDPHIVNRVREYLSTPPSYVEGISSENQCYFTPTQVTITPSSPLQKSPPVVSSNNKPSKIRQPTPITHHHHNNPTSPNRQPPPSSKSTSSPPPIKKKLKDTLDEIDSVKGGTNHITFTDDIFINHAQSTTPHLPKSQIPIRSPPHSTNGDKNNGSSNNNRAQKHNPNPAAVVTPCPFGPVTVGNRKNYETFVMTGDAILNVSKLRNEDSTRSSPTKTSSKLTPLDKGPAPPHQIYPSPRAAAKANLAQFPPPVPVVGDNSESSEVSPPLPPPPTSNSTSSSTSDSITNVTVKSDNLPPPPPSLMMEDEQTAQSQSNGIAIAESVVKCNETNANTTNNCLNEGTGNKSSNLPKTNKLPPTNNNEDTSISSSVMSDSGGEDGEDTEQLLELDTDVKDLKVRTKSIPSKKSSVESGTSEDGDHPIRKEKERYNEYFLLNGTRGVVAVDDEEDRSSIETRNAEALGYEKMTSPNDSDEEDEKVGEGSDEGEESTPPGKRLKKLVSGDSYSGGDSDGSDVESMRIAPVTKAVDLPSAERLAKRLYSLDGFKVSDVWRQLSKANDFSREVATYFLRYFDFKDETLDISLRKFLNVCPLRGETQERERVLTYFSTRYVDCNPNFLSPDAVHTLSCALMLLNTDMYSGVRGMMTCKAFISNLAGMNDGQNFPEPVLKKLYQSIKSKPLASPQDVDDEESARESLPIDPSVTTSTKEYKRGYLKRKSIFEQGGKKTPLGKRSWKLYYCRLRELLLSLAPDENSKATVVQNIQPLKLHHCLATIASDYRKKPYVFCLTLSDKSQFLFQSSDIREMHSWIDNLNLNAAKFSSPALEAPIGSSKKFETPLLPSAISRLSSRDQLITHQSAMAKWEEELEELNQTTSSKRGGGNKRDAKERSEFYKSEIQRYKAYVDVLERHLSDLNGGSGLESTTEELVELQVLPNPPSVLIEMDENGS